MVLTIFLKISAYSFYPPFFYKINQALIVSRNMTILLIIIDISLHVENLKTKLCSKSVKHRQIHYKLHNKSTSTTLYYKTARKV